MAVLDIKEGEVRLELRYSVVEMEWRQQFPEMFKDPNQ